MVALDTGVVLAFTRYCYYQYCTVYSIHTGDRKGSRIMSNNRATVLHQGGQCTWAGGGKGWLIRAQPPRTKQISCKGQAWLRRSGVNLASDQAEGVVAFWPLQDIRLLWGFRARINHPFIALPPPALPILSQCLCATIARYTTPPRPPLCMPYTIQCW